MSDHSNKDRKDFYTPKDFDNASHVYVKVDSPVNLGQKYVGPHPIIDRPSNTTITIRVGYDKEGLPRLQAHHWSNCRVAHLRPDAEEFNRPGPGRPKNSKAENYVNFNMAANPSENDAPETNNKLTAKSATWNNLVTQPRTERIGTRLQQTPAAPADLGGDTLQAETTLPPTDALSGQVQITGAPPIHPFRNYQPKQTSSRFPDDDETSWQQPSATPSLEGYGSHPCLNEPSGTPGQQPGTSSPSRPAELADHDYTSRRPPPLTDHNYFMSVPLPDTDPRVQRVQPPPGFTDSHGRPKRNRNLPTRFNDYDISEIK